MRALAETVAAKLRSWVGRDSPQSGPAHPGQPRTLSGVDAARAVDQDLGASLLDGNLIAAERAVALAATGRRATLLIPTGGLAAALDALADASDRRVALVALVRLGTGRHARRDRAAMAGVAERGLVLATAADSQQAADSTAIARQIAESILAPVVVVLQGQAATDAASECLVVEGASLRTWLAAPDELVDAATAAQALLFGAQRPQLLPRFDLLRPAAVGSALSDRDEAAAAASRVIFFGSELRGTVARILGAWLERTGREVSACWTAPPAPQGASGTTELDGALGMARNTVFPRREVLLQGVARDYPRAMAANGGDRPAAQTGLDSLVPAALRQRRDDQPDCHNLGRFWGEFLQPRLCGEAAGEVDPWLAGGTVPAAAAELFDRSAERARVPQIDFAACSGCGKCWVACPDGALCPVALSTVAWLDAAAERATSGRPRAPAADRLRRMHKQIGARLDDELGRAQGRTVSAEALQAAFGWAADKALLVGDERAAVEVAFAATAREATRLQAAATPALFHSPNSASKGAGLLLQISVDPRTCQDCGICTAVCPEQAIAPVDQSEQRLQALRAAWGAWDQTPDTVGQAMNRAAQVADLRGMGALLLSRHGQQALAGADAATPGSGQRLATRLAMAVLEQQRQIQMVRQLEALTATLARLNTAVQATFAAAAPSGDHEAMLAALAGTGSRTTSLKELSERLAQQGLGSSVDVVKLRRLVQAARDAETLRAQLTSGAEGRVKARCGVLIVGQSVADWAGQFGPNPFGAPVWVDTTDGAMDAALGLAQGLAEAALDEVRTGRAAALALDGAADMGLQLAALEGLTLADLTLDERAQLSPLVVLVDRHSLQRSGLAGLHRALASHLPIKVLYLDDGALSGDLDPVASAIAQRKAFVGATSVAHDLHLRETVTAALRTPGPALVSVLALQPQACGMDPADIIESSRLAVIARVHPLLQFLPGGPGIAGGLSLEGNPQVDALWGCDEAGQEQTPDLWMAGQGRFAQWTPARRAQALQERQDWWTTLQELTGIVSPLADKLRAEVRSQLAQVQAAEIQALAQSHADVLAEREAAWRAESAVRLREQLLRLIASAPPRVSGAVSGAISGGSAA